MESDERDRRHAGSVSSFNLRFGERLNRMDRSRVLAVLALGALLLLAGCQAPGTPQNADFAPEITVVNTTGAEQGTTIAVANNETIDPGVVYAQVQNLLGTNAEPPNNVRVIEDVDSMAPNVSTFESPVRQHLNVTRRGDLDLGDQENGAVNALGGITIYPGEARNPESTTWVLAHELVHYVQVRNGHWGGLADRIGMGTTDGQFTHRAMMEGPAVYTTERYLDEYGHENSTTLTLYRTIEDGLPPGSAGEYANRQYLLGYQYVRSQVDSPEEIEALYNESALTSEHLIHGYAPDEEPMADLAVSYDGGEDWRVTGRDRMGEAFVWSAFEDRLGTERARQAAAGWGNDSLLTTYPTDEGNASFAWVIRWDDAANATQFAEAAGAYLERAESAHGDAAENATGEDLHRLQTGAFADVERAGDRTTVVLIGDRPFVDRTTATAEAGEVDVETADE